MDPIIISIVALVVSAANAIYQSRVRGPRIQVLNANDVQKDIALKFDDLPMKAKNNLSSPYKDREDIGHVLVKVVFGNFGDRAGVISIKDVSVKVKDERSHPLQYSTPGYVFVPAYEIVEHEILLANIPIATQLEIDISVTMEKVGYSLIPYKKSFRKIVKIHLYEPDDERLWFMW